MVKLELRGLSSTIHFVLFLVQGQISTSLCWLEFHPIQMLFGTLKSLKCGEFYYRLMGLNHDDTRNIIDMIRTTQT